MRVITIYDDEREVNITCVIHVVYKDLGMSTVEYASLTVEIKQDALLHFKDKRIPNFQGKSS